MTCREGRSADWVKVKNPKAPAVKPYARINKRLSEYIRRLETELEYRVTHD
jgi:hypothetical protein